MKAIALSFTFKGLSNEEFEKVAAHVRSLSPKSGEDQVILIHGHMPRKIVEQKGWDTKLCDLLDECFPIQLNMYHEKTLRPEMAETAYLLDADIYVIGDGCGGVAEEIALYEAEGCNEIKYIEL